MDQGNEEEVDHTLYLKAVEEAGKIIAKVQSDMAKVAESISPMMQNLQESISAVAAATNISMNGLGGEIYSTQKLMTDLTLENIRQESETESHHIEIEDGIINELQRINRRLDKLENRNPQPYPELEALRKQVTEQEAQLKRYSVTLETLEVWSQGKLNRWFKDSFGGGSKNG